jgi:5-methylcytosine-specific restriction enzyme subunit McrC
MLPSMLTDISLRSPEHTLIIDAKYYSKTFQTHHGKTSINSGNLYQIYSYLKSLELEEGNDKYASGMLLYPVVNSQVSHSYVIDGHQINIETIDLAQDWREIEANLIGLLN